MSTMNNNSLGDSKYSVLLLGKTQAGKSTFIGHYTESKTGKLEQFAVRSNLPEYEVYDNNTGAPIDTHTLSQRLQDSDDYKDIENVRETFLRMAPLDPKVVPEEPFVIRFLDTPGINDTNYRDIEHAQTIIDEIVRIKSFNLIFVVISIHPAIHKEQSVAFDYYSRVIKALQGHHSNVVFLYTHVKYEDCHQNNTKHQTNLQQKHKAFSYLFRERGNVAPEGEIDLQTDIKQDVELYPFYTIDHSIRERPVIQCMIQKTIREIHQKAVWSQPASGRRQSQRRERLQRLHVGQQTNLGQQHSAESVRSAASEQEGAAVGSVEAVEAAAVGKDTQDEDTGEYSFTATSVVKYDSDSDDGEEKGESVKEE
ncbi:hypothetical protein BG005_009830 [Podila minutissima]|nr:hypothetical protein BG005_009830 [Podila minutissima]